MIGGREREVVYRRREKEKGGIWMEKYMYIEREKKKGGREGGKGERGKERGEQKNDTLLPLTVRTTFLAPECFTEGPGKT